MTRTPEDILGRWVKLVEGPSSLIGHEGPIIFAVEQETGEALVVMEDVISPHKFTCLFEDSLERVLQRVEFMER